jgi:hypothetical protein
MRVAASTAVACMALLVPAAASACVDPHIAPPGAQAAPAGPNDRVPFTISHTEPGAHYTVSVDGVTVIDDGVDVDGSGVSDGVFSMPDLRGGTRGVTVAAEVDHDGQRYEAGQFEITYRGSDPPSTAPGASPAPAPPAGQSAPAGRSEARPSVQGSRPQEPATGRHGGSSPGAGSALPGDGHVTGTSGSAGRSGSLAAITHRAVPAPATASVQQATRTQRHGAAADDVERGSSRTPRAPIEVAARPTIRVQPASPGLPVPTLAVLGALLVVGPALAFAFRRRRGGPGGNRQMASPPPVPPDAARSTGSRHALIEAELQEIVAEARARELEADPDAVETGPG